MTRVRSRLGSVTALGALALPLLGMGGFGGGRDLGTPARDYRGTLVDADGTRVEVTRLSIGGDPSLEGEIGRGRLRVPLDNIARVTFAPAGADRERMTADIQLRAGDPVKLTVRSTTTFYGQTPGGAYSIRARDLRSVEIAP